MISQNDPLYEKLLKAEAWAKSSYWYSQYDGNIPGTVKCLEADLEEGDSNGAYGNAELYIKLLKAQYPEEFAENTRLSNWYALEDYRERIHARIAEFPVIGEAMKTAGIEDLDRLTIDTPTEEMQAGYELSKEVYNQAVQLADKLRKLQPPAPVKPEVPTPTVGELAGRNDSRDYQPGDELDCDDPRAD